MLQLFKQITHIKKFSRLSILVVVAVSVLLTGCIGVQTNLGLYGEGQWSGVQAITLSPELIKLKESGGTDTKALDDWLQHAQDMAADESLNVTFNEVSEEDGSLTYVLQADGNGYESLNAVFFQGKADISVAEVEGKRQVTISYDTSKAIEGAAMPEGQEISAETMAASGSKIITRISGGKIIDNNADRVESNTAFWETPGLIEITLTEADIFDTGTLAPQAMQLGSSPSLTTPAEEEQSTENAPTESTAESVETPQETAPATGPATEDQALPPTGAILPGSGSTASLVLAGLVLISLVGAGAATIMLNREE